MFTGLVEAMAVVRTREGQRLVLERPALFDDVQIGSSIAVSGVCLSVISLRADTMAFDVVRETLDRTKMGDLRPDDRVNLERALRADGRFGGHVVQGHVEGVGEITTKGDLSGLSGLGGLGSGTMMTVRIPKELQACVVPKGSITLDGVALTVAAVDGDRCTVALIPLTLAETTFGERKEGDRVNIETDVFLRAVLYQNGRNS